MLPNPIDNPQFWLLNAPFFALLLLLSICSISLIIEKLLLLGYWRWHSYKLPAKISLLLKDNEMEQLGLLLEPEHGPEAILLRKSFYFIKYEAPSYSSISKTKATQEYLFELKEPPTFSQIHHLEQWLESCIEELGLQMEKHCNLFHLIANVSTLLGLLGTVTGMIYAFQSGALEQSTQLAQGISHALITTAGGLIVAIPAIISQQLFLNSSALRIFTLKQLGCDILLFMHQHLAPEHLAPKSSRELTLESKFTQEANIQELPAANHGKASFDWQIFPRRPEEQQTPYVVPPGSKNLASQVPHQDAAIKPAAYQVIHPATAPEDSQAPPKPREIRFATTRLAELQLERLHTRNLQLVHSQDSPNPDSGTSATRKPSVPNTESRNTGRLQTIPEEKNSHSSSRINQSTAPKTSNRAQRK